MKILYPAIYFLAAKAQITPLSPPSKQLDSNLDSLSQTKLSDPPCYPYIPITVMGHEVVPSCADQEPLPEGDASSFDSQCQQHVPFTAFGHELQPKCNPAPVLAEDNQQDSLNEADQ